MNREEYTKLQKRLLSYGRVCFGNNLEEQELAIWADDALSTAYENKASGAYVKTSAQFSTYVFTIFRHKCLNRIKALGIRKDYRHSVQQKDAKTDHIAKDNFLEKEEYRKVIKSAMEQLCDKCQKVLILKYFEGKNMKEIAATMKFRIEM